MTQKKAPVGFGNPPAHSRFKPGFSGNPRGRPKKLPSLRSEIFAELGKLSTCDGEKISNAAKIAKILVNSAGGGSMRAISELLAFCAKQQAEGDIGDGTTIADAEIFDEFIDRQVRRRAEENETKSHASEASEPVGEIGTKDH